MATANININTNANANTRVLLFATHIHSTNGYCLVGHALGRELAKRKDIELTYYGFQNFHKNQAHMSKRTLPANVFVYDAFENENPKGLGFGFDQVTEFVTMNKPDVCIIYNDMVVVSTILDKLKAVPNKNFKIIVYIDQVYLYQKKEHVKKLNEEADMVLAFTPYWKDCIVEQGLTTPLDFLRHGFDPYQHYPVPKKLARAFFGLKEEDFIILNLNRNQPRKRWDICLQAFAEIVSRHLMEPIKLLIATAVNGSWNLIEVFERELKKRGITLEEGMKHLIIIDNPQQITDDEVNILYNVADIGFSTADGEGFGLCGFQQAAIGVPQVLPAIGGFLDFFAKDSAILVDPKINLYIDNGRDGVGGECQICEWKDFVDGIEAYYADKTMVERHGQTARQHILKDYAWKDIGDKLYKVCKKVCNHPEVEVQTKTESIGEDISIEDIEKLLGERGDTPSPAEASAPVVVASTGPEKLNIPSSMSKKNSVKERLREKLRKRHENTNNTNTTTTTKKEESLDIDSLIELKSKIEKLIDQKKSA